MARLGYHAFKGTIHLALQLLDEAQQEDGWLRIPMGFETGVEGDRVIEDVVQQMHSIAEEFV